MPAADIETAQLIVCETDGLLARLLRRELESASSASGSARVRESRSLADCDRLLAIWPASLVAIDVTRRNFAAALLWLASLERRFPAARAIAFLERGLEPHTAAIREAGAVYIAPSRRKTSDAARLATEHLERAPQREMSVVERIEAGLPWPRNSSATTASRHEPHHDGESPWPPKA